MAAALMAVIGCSTQKNTSQSRWWHSFNAKYNTYYNGAQAYIDASLEKENGNKDNFTELIPLYTVGNKQSRELGKGNYDRAIEKAQKAIHQHSIKKKPEWTKNRRKTERDIEWLSRREYNPFLWKAWMLMGRSQFHKGAFDEAAATFSYMSRLYSTQPAIYGKARAWLAKCYIEQDWVYDAEDVIRNMRRDSIDWRAVKEWDYTLADYYIHTGALEEAIPYLRKVIKHEMRRKQKAREWYLMGQLHAALGHREEAYKAFRSVIRQNPPYELEFNARIAMTEVMAGGRSKQMISRLKRMAASDNNKDYLDQIYYAMGNIYLNEKDTANAISAYEKGNEKSARNGIEKGVLLLHLGDLYWSKEKFGDARRCYGEAIGLLDKDRKDYEQLSYRSKVLDELVPYTDAIHLQDSLQELAKMPEAERNAAIDRVIEALKKKEKEERRKQAEEEAAEVIAKNAGNSQGLNAGRNARTNQTTPQQQKDAQWYFYNPMAVSQGKSTFQQQWGRRENADDWQRSNKTVVNNVGAAEQDLENLTDEQRDSIYAAEQLQDSLKQVADSAQNDPHKREYYLAQIPFTEEQVVESNKIIADGLHHAGVIFKDRLDMLDLSEKHLRRVTDQYPDYEQMDDVFYHLFLLYSRRGMGSVADSYVTKLKNSYPESSWTAILSDPHFIENSKFGVHIEDSLYAATYEAFKKDRYAEVLSNAHLSETRFPLGANREKFLFIGGMSKLNNGDLNGCLDDMKQVVEKYPSSRISELAGMIVNGVNAGKRLRGGKFSLDDVWNRRAAVLNDSDSIAARGFTADRLTDFKFILAYHPDSISENKLLFEVAKFNFTHFVVRNFDIEITDIDDLHAMQLSGFRSYDEAFQYAREMYETKSIVQQMGKAKGIIISNENLELIGARFSYKDYDEFYAKHFAPLRVSQRYLLSEPAEVATPRERDLEEEIQSKAPTLEDIDAMQNNEAPADNNYEIPDDETTLPMTAPATDEPQPETVETPAEEEPTGNVLPDENTYDIPDEPTQDVPAGNNDFVIPDEAPTLDTPAEDTYDIDDGPEPAAAEPATSEPPTAPRQPAPTPETPSAMPVPAVVPTEPDTPVDDDDINIIFDDDINTGTTPNSQKTQPQNFNIEDEYYDLDGF